MSSPVRAEGGNTVFTHGGYRVHVFESSGKFRVKSGGGECDVLVVAGGGGGVGQGPNSYNPGGGGAGGVMLSKIDVSSGDDLTVTVGKGGKGFECSEGGDCDGGQADNGEDSSVSGITALGGGGGGARNADGRDGGSGGGCRQGTAGKGLQEDKGGFGNDGGDTGGDDLSNNSGGGGGAGEPGNSGNDGGGGGTGKYFGDMFSSRVGENGWFAGGGGGTSSNNSGAPGGKGGGGDGKTLTDDTQDFFEGGGGIAGTGGGGGASQSSDGSYGETFKGGDGGSGVVVFRYKLGIIAFKHGDDDGTGGVFGDLSPENIRSRYAEDEFGRVQVVRKDSDRTVYSYTPPKNMAVAALLVIGGGGGAPSTGADTAGSGAGGMVLHQNFALHGGKLSVSVGGGGAQGVQGQDSWFEHLHAIGGGTTNGNVDGLPGGSGGGAGRNRGTGGRALQPHYGSFEKGVKSYGHPGGDNDGTNTEGAGGGGAGAPGDSILNSPSPRRGGDGLNMSSLFGSEFGDDGWFCGGGGGGGEQDSPSDATGGKGGGGDGGHLNGNRNGSPGQPHSGGGGGGSDNNTGGVGGSGIVLVRLQYIDLYVMPRSGEIRFSDLRKAFGGSGPVAFSDYFNGKSNVRFQMAVPRKGDGGPLRLRDFAGLCETFRYQYADDFSRDTSSRYLINQFDSGSGAGWVWEPENNRLRSDSSNNRYGLRLRPELMPLDVSRIEVEADYLGTEDDDWSGVMLHDAASGAVWLAGITDDAYESGILRVSGLNSSSYEVKAAAFDLHERDAETVRGDGFGQGGDEVYRQAGYRMHVFKSSGTFTANEDGRVDVFLVGGGGGTARNSGASGSAGGGGGYARSYYSLRVRSGDDCSVVVGDGGGTGTDSMADRRGGTSSFDIPSSSTTNEADGGEGNDGSTPGPGGSGGGRGRGVEGSNARPENKLHRGGSDGSDGFGTNLNNSGASGQGVSTREFNQKRVDGSWVVADTTSKAKLYSGGGSGGGVPEDYFGDIGYIEGGAGGGGAAYPTGWGSIDEENKKGQDGLGGGAGGTQTGNPASEGGKGIAIVRYSLHDRVSVKNAHRFRLEYVRDTRELKFFLDGRLCAACEADITPSSFGIASINQDPPSFWGGLRANIHAAFTFFDDFSEDTSNRYIDNQFLSRGIGSRWIWDTDQKRLRTDSTNSDYGLRVKPELLPSDIHSIDIVVEYLGTEDDDWSGIMLYDEPQGKVWLAGITDDYQHNGIMTVPGLTSSSYQLEASGANYPVTDPHEFRLTYSKASETIEFYVDRKLSASHRAPDITITSFGIASLAQDPPSLWGSIRARVNAPHRRVPDAEGGEEVYEYGGYRFHVFKGSSGYFKVNRERKFDVLVVGGGGAGGYRGHNGSDNNSGGGGAGGLVFERSVSLVIGGYEARVGKGGDAPAGSGSPDVGRSNAYAALWNGEDSTFAGYRARGGGGGGHSHYEGDGDGTNGTGAAGGSGGGADSSGGSGGSSTQEDGGFGNSGASADGSNGGGGGGAGSPGSTGSDDRNGGDGLNLRAFFGRDLGDEGWFAGGGGPCNNGDGGSVRGGRGGGGDGYQSGSAAKKGKEHTGGGGGGNSELSSSEDNGGGSGVVVVRYLVSERDGALNTTGLLHSPVAAYSLRRLFNEYTEPQVRVKRATDGVEADVYFDNTGRRVRLVKQSNGFTTVDLETWSDGSDITVTKWYDQSGEDRTAIAASSDEIYLKKEDGRYALYGEGTSKAFMEIEKSGGNFSISSLSKSGVTVVSTFKFVLANCFLIEQGEGNSRGFSLFTHGTTSHDDGDITWRASDGDGSYVSAGNTRTGGRLSNYSSYLKDDFNLWQGVFESDGTGLVRGACYINGELGDQRSLPGREMDGPDDARLFNHRRENNYNLNGYVSDLIVFAQALSDDQMKAFSINRHLELEKDTFVYVGGENGTLYKIEKRSLNIVNEKNIADDGIETLRLSNYGETIYVGALDTVMKVKTADLTTETSRTVSSSPVRGMYLSLDNKTLIYSSDNIVYKARADTLETVKTSPGEFNSRYEGLAVSPKEQYIACANIDGLVVLDYESLTVLKSVEYGGRTLGLAFDWDNKHLFHGDSSQNVYKRRTSDWEVVESREVGESGGDYLERGMITPDGRHWYVGDRRFISDIAASVSKISTDNLSVVSTYSNTDSSRVSGMQLAISGSGGENDEFLYVYYENGTFQKLRTSDFTVIKSISLSNGRHHGDMVATIPYVEHYVLR